MTTRLIQIFDKETRKKANSSVLRLLTDTLGVSEPLPDNVLFPDLFVFAISCPICNLQLATVASMRKETTQKYDCPQCRSTNKLPIKEGV